MSEITTNTASTTQAEEGTQSVVEVMTEKQKVAAICKPLKDAGAAIGNYMVKKEKIKGELREKVQALVKESMAAGLQVEMLKASSEKVTRPAYDAFVNAIAKARGIEWDDSNKAVRDNYMSKVRAFVKDRGANPLDLFGNFAQKKAAEDKKLESNKKTENTASTTQAEDDDADNKVTVTETREREVDLKGLPALNTYLVAWLAANGECIPKYKDLVADVQKQIEKALPKAKK